MKLLLPLSISFGLFSAFLGSSYLKSLNEPGALTKVNMGRIPSSYNFGGSCVSKGKWVSDALKASSELKSAIKLLAESPECEGLSKVLETFPVVPPTTIPPILTSKDEVGHDLSELTHTAFSGGTASSLTNALFGKTIENTYKRIKFSKENPDEVPKSSYGMGLVNGMLAEIPNHQRCLQAKPSAMNSILLAAVRVASSYSGGQNQILSGIDKTMTTLISFFRKKQFSNALAHLDRSEYFNSLSCLVESVTNNFCNAYDAKIMLSKYQDFKNDLDSDTELGPFQGYLALTRDSDIVSTWLLKVMFGVEPKLIQDAQYKNKILDNVTEFLQDVNNLTAQLNDFKTNLDAQKDLAGKKTFLLSMIETLLGTITQGFNRTSRGDVNFYQWIGIPVEQMPYFLIGRKLPKEALTSKDNPVPMKFREYVQYMGNNDKNNPAWIPEFNDPNTLYNLIKTNIKVINSKAAEQSRNYFRKRFIIDIPNLVTETMTDTRVTVKQALKNILAYLTKSLSYYRTQNDKEDFDIEILSFTAGTINDIQTILNSFKDLQGLVSNIVDFSKTYDIDDPEFEKEIQDLANNKEILGSYDKIIDVVYDKFNILLQRDTYLQSRIETMVRFEYSHKIKHSNNLDEFQKYAMIIAGQNVLEETLGSSYTLDPNAVDKQLNSAMLVHEGNLRSLEELFSDPILGVIRHLKGVTNEDRYQTQKQFFKDSMSYELSLYKPILNANLYKERYFLENFSWKKPQYLDNYYGSTEQFRNRLCLQSLAFHNKSKFAPVCMGTVLDSPNTPEQLDGKPLNERYDRLMLKYLTVLKPLLKDRKSRTKRKRVRKLYERELICGFRNMMRRNRVFNLLQSFEKERMESQ